MSTAVDLLAGNFDARADQTTVGRIDEHVVFFVIDLNSRIFFPSILKVLDFGIVFVDPDDDPANIQLCRLG